MSAEYTIPPAIVDAIDEADRLQAEQDEQDEEEYQRSGRKPVSIEELTKIVSRQSNIKRRKEAKKPKKLTAKERKALQDTVSQAQRNKNNNAMNSLFDIVINNQRDMQLVKQALGIKGATVMVDRHNAKIKDDNKKWHIHNHDMNNDGIKDLVIHRGLQKDDTESECGAERLYINGWKVKQSEYPLLKRYLNRFPTAEARKGNRYRDFKLEYKTAQERNDEKMLNGLMKRIDASGYAKPKQINPYLEFQNKLFIPNAKRILQRYNIKYDATIMSQIATDMYIRYIVSKIPDGKNNSNYSVLAVKEVSKLKKALHNKKDTAIRDNFMNDINYSINDNYDVNEPLE